MPPALRLLPLPLCIACALAAHHPAAAADDIEPDWGLCPIEEAVPAFPDAQPATADPAARESLPTDIAGDNLEGVDGENVAYSGNVTLRRGDQFLGADNLEYRSGDSTYVATGRVRYQDAGMRLVAERLEGDQEADTHRVDNVEYQLTERRGNGGAERVEMKGAQGSLYGSTYSTCTPSDRWWELRAERIDIDNDKGQGIARNATLRVGKVPVLYVPIFAFPTDSRRKTGLLYPSISYSSRNGFDWRQPIYLNLAPHYDMTLEPRLMTRRGFMLGTEFRYRTDGGRGVFDVELFPSDQLARDGRQDEIEDGIDADNWRKEDRGLFRFNGRQNLDRNWQARANLAWASDPRYIEDSSSNLNGRTNFSIKSDLGVYGRGRTWDAGVMADYWQLGDYTRTESILAYHRLPRAFLNWEDGFGRWFVAGASAEAVRFRHADDEARPGGSRLDVKPWVSMPLEGAAWFITPTLAWRYTAYELEDRLARRIGDDNGTAPDDTPSRSLPIGTVDAGVYFDRTTLFRGESHLHTLEPRLFYVNAPYRDQSALPLFDTQNMSHSWGQLFRDNRFTGADRQADANQLTLALTTRLVNSETGRETLSASIGQIRYFEDSRVGLSANSPVIPEGKSTWIAEASYEINDRWSVGGTYHWNPATRQEDLAGLRARYLIGDDGVVNLAYRYRRSANRPDRDLLEQVDFSFLYPINPSWSLVGRYYYSLMDKQLLEGIAGVQWDSCCMAARLVARRYVRDLRGNMNDAIQFELEFKGLGSAGPETASRLRRAILGYHREDLYLVPPPDVRNDDGDPPSADDIFR